MATSPALGMDTYVPNDTIRAKPDWAALTKWTPGEMPKGISGLPMEDSLLLAFVVGRRRAAIMPLGSTLALVLSNCTVTGRGGTKSVVARREGTWPVIELSWSITLSSGHVLARTARGVLMAAKRGEPLVKVNLESLGYSSEDEYPEMTFSFVIAAGVDEAYLVGEVGSPTDTYYLYHLKKNALTSVNLAPLSGFPQDAIAHDFLTDYDGRLFVRTYTAQGTRELISVDGSTDTGAVVDFSANSFSQGFRLFTPVVIGQNRLLCVRYGMDREGVIRDTKSSILTSTIGLTKTDLASTGTNGENFLDPPSIFALGDMLAIVVMPRVVPNGYNETSNYNAGFGFDSAYTYWAIESTVPVGGYTYKTWEILVTDGVQVAPLFRDVAYNRTVTVIPLGAGKAILFFAMGNFPGTDIGGFHPEMHYFDGSTAHRVNVTDIWPDVAGMCVGDGTAVFITGNTDTADVPTWYRFKDATLFAIGPDAHWRADRIAQPMTIKGYIREGVGVAFREHTDVDALTVASHVYVFGAPAGDMEIELRFEGVWHRAKSFLPLKNAAVITSFVWNPNVATTRHHFSYLAITGTSVVLTYLGGIDSVTAPTVVNVSAGTALIQLDEGVKMVSAGENGIPAVSAFSAPTGWTGELVPIGEEFMMFSPSTVRDLRPGILASSGQI